MTETKTAPAGARTQFVKGERVKSIANRHGTTYRILKVEKTRAKLEAEGCGYYTCYCPLELLEKV